MNIKINLKAERCIASRNLSFFFALSEYMVTAAKFRDLAMSFTDVVEQPHFRKASFRIGKKILATLSEKEKIACIKLTEKEQALFIIPDPLTVYPVPNKWGKQGWTFVNLSKIKVDLLRAMLSSAYDALSARQKK
jgi:hypothetical protein